MKISDNEKVNDFLNDLNVLSPEKLEIVECIRSVFQSTGQGIDEDIKYGGIVYSVAGTLIGGIFPYANHISIEFSNGSEFIDSDAVLEGKGKKRRHIKIHTLSDIGSKKAELYIKQAVGEEN